MLHTDEEYIGLLEESAGIELELWLVVDHADVTPMKKAMGKAPTFS